MLSSQLFEQPFLVIQISSGYCFLPLVGGTTWTIGRSNDNNLVLPDRLISRHHAVLQLLEDGAFYLLDLISRNGSFVNGCSAIVPARLRHGDRLKFGNTNLAFCCLGANPLVESPATQETSTTQIGLRFVCRLVSVMVIDLRNLTALTQHLDQQFLSPILDTWCQDITNIITSLGGLLDTNVGDLGVIKAIWFHRYHGVNHEDIRRIFQAISDIKNRNMQLNRELFLPLALRMVAGINTGYGIVDNTRIGQSLYYLSLEHTVNAAVRLGSAIKKIGCDLALAESTYKCLSTLNNLESVFQPYTINLKDYNNPIVTYGGLLADIDKLLK